MSWLILILTTSILLQLGAAILALRMMRTTRVRPIWLLLASAFLALASHHALVLFSPARQTTADLLHESFVLVASVLFLLGMLGIRRLFMDRTRVERHYKAVLDTASDGFMVIEEGGRIAEVNDSYLQLMGLRAEDMIGRPIAEFELCPANPSPTCVTWDTALRQGLHRFESVHRHLTGTPVPVELSVSRNTGESGCTFAFLHDITPRLLQQQSIRESEERLRASIEHTPNVAVQWYDADARVVFWNRASELMFGYRADEAMGKSLEHLIFAKETADSFAQLISQLQTSQAPFGPAEFSFRRKDGTPGVCLSTVFPIPVGHGKRLVVCMDVDLTERKQSEQAIQRNNLILEAIGRAQAQFISESGAGGAFDQMLKSFLELTESECGFIARPAHSDLNTLSAPVGSPLVIVWDEATRSRLLRTPNTIPPVNEVELQPLLQSIIRDQVALFRNPSTSTSPEYTPPTATSTPAIQTFMGLPVSYQGSTLAVVGLANRKHGYDPDLARFLEPLLRTCGTLIDAVRVHQLNRQAAEVLRQSEERYRTLIEISPNGVAVVRDGILVFCNSSAVTIFGGSTIDQALGKSFEKFVHPDFIPITRERLAMALREGWVPPVEMSYLRLDGTAFPVEVKSCPITFEGRKSLLVIFTDLTERKQAETEQRRLETQLRQSQKMEAIGTLAGGIAHDFNNLIGAIVGNAELLRSDVPETNLHARESISEILKASTRARDLVQSILTFSKPKSRERELVQIQPILTEVIRLLRRTLPATIEIESRLEPGSAAIHADPTQMHQVIMNLCTNAAHAMRSRTGLLEIELQTVQINEAMVRSNPQLREGRFVRVTIRDNGHGMDAATQERIFEPFFTTKGPGEGTGLGLSVVHGIVRSHHGSVTVESRIGVGTAFHLYFPAIDVELVNTIPSIQTLERGAGEHLLLVDDEASLIVPTHRALESLGYRVTARQNPVEALATFQASPHLFHLVISDLTMPKMSGLQLSEEILRIRPGIPIVMISGYSGFMENDAIRQVGVRAWLEKPFQTVDLARVLHRCLKENVSAAPTT